MGLAALAQRAGKPADERAILDRAVAAGTQSGTVFARLAQVELAAGAIAAAEKHGAQAATLLPEFAPSWWVWGEAAEKAGRPADAIARYKRAIESGLDTAAAALHLGRLLAQQGQAAAARPYLERAARDAGSPHAAEARRVLDSLR